jgi:cytochrome c oxidase cbb3-type subunit 1
MMTIGTMYHLIPRLFNRQQMYSVKLIDVHFWTSTIGVVLYITAMWIAGVMQGLMWRAFNADGTLTYSFIESVKATYPFYLVRLAGGALFFIGMWLMAYNVWMTIRHEKPRPVPVPLPVGEHTPAPAAAAAASGAQA